MDQEEILKQQSEILADIAELNDREHKKQPSVSTAPINESNVTFGVIGVVLVGVGLVG